MFPGFLLLFIIIIYYYLLLNKDKEIESLGSWVSTQQNNYKKKEQLMKNEEIYNKWTEFLLERKRNSDNETNWSNTLDKVKKYIDENKKRPTLSNKNKENQVLYSWLYTQQRNYKIKEHLMKNEDIYNTFTEFLTKYQEYFLILDNETQWYNTFDKVKKYIDENKKKPSRHDKNKEIGCLGTWIQRQQQNYKNKKQMMENEEIYNKYTEFLSKYQEYILVVGHETQWNNTLHTIKKYINENNKLPREVDNNVLYNWIQTQKKNYKDKQDIMRHENIINEWFCFITEYQEYFSNSKIIKEHVLKLNTLQEKDIKEFVERPIFPKKKSTIIEPKTNTKDKKNENNKNNLSNSLSNYQELSKKMTIQKSSTTNNMFENEPNLWVIS